jgi:hypothetical protein
MKKMNWFDYVIMFILIIGILYCLYRVLEPSFMIWRYHVTITR